MALSFHIPFYSHSRLSYIKRLCGTINGNSYGTMVRKSLATQIHNTIFNTIRQCQCVTKDTTSLCVNAAHEEH